jgi:predicted acylesterase/phospholipase RssA
MKLKHPNALLFRQPVRSLLPAHGLRAGRLPLSRAVGGREGTHFENVVFAGGGNRCFWQAGFWSVAAPALSLSPSRVTAVSAGSAMACTLFSNTFYAGFRQYKKALAANGSNLHLRNLLRDQPVFPHGSMYRDAILSSINEPALSRLHRGPEISILISCPPRWASPGVALLLGMIATGIDDWRSECVHSSAGCRIGFSPLFISVRECTTPESLADLIIASSCVPPLTPQARRNGIALLDGGFVSNVPTQGVSEANGQTLVLLTRQFRQLPSIPGRIYVQPSKPVPVSAWDYTDDAAVQSTFDLGRRDGERFCLTIARSGINA